MELTEQPEWLALLQPGQCSSRSQAAAVTVGAVIGAVTVLLRICANVVTVASHTWAATRTGHAGPGGGGRVDRELTVFQHRCCQTEQEEEEEIKNK